MISKADLDYIFTWTNATKMTIIDNSNVALRLFRRGDELRAFDKLTFLKVYIPSMSMERIRLRSFFENLPSLTRIEFVFYNYGTSNQETEEFLAEQFIPREFKRGEDIRHNWQEFRKTVVYEKIADGQ